MKSERLLLRDAHSLTFDASSFKMAETLIMARGHSIHPYFADRNCCFL